MPDSIKGLTAKIGADTSDFSKELKKVDKEINATAKTANELEKSLKLDFDEKRFIQAQKKAQQALTQTNEKAEAIRKQLKYLENTSGVDTDSYRKLETELAKTETTALKLSKQLEEINNIKMTNLTNSLKDVSGGLNKAASATKGLSIAAAGAAAGMVKLAKDAVNATDDIATFATNYGLSIEAIQKWDYVARQSDVESEQLYKSLQKLNVAMGDQLIGNTSNATKALDKLGLSAKDFESADDMLYALIKEMSELGSVTEQTAIASDIFGERYASTLISLFAQGEDAIKGYINEFSQIGVLSDEVVKKGADMDNTMRMATQAFTNAKIELGVALIPVLEILADLLKNDIIPIIKSSAKWFDGLGESGQKTTLVILAITAALSPMLSMMSKIVSIVPAVIKVFNVLKTSLANVTIAAVGLTASVGVIISTLANWDKMSGIQKVIALIGGLTAAVLSAAVAFGVFHSAWSIGLAAAGIIAGITASIAAINAAKKEIEIPSDIPDYNASDYSNAVTGNPNTAQNNNGGGTNYSVNSDYNININMNATGNLEYDSKALADEVIKQIVIKKQAAGY